MSGRTNPGGGSKPGERRGGKKTGTPNRRTLVVQELATLEARRTAVLQELDALQKSKRTVADRKAGRRTAMEVLDELMTTAMGMAATHQPLPPNIASAPPGRQPDPTKFMEYATFARECAASLIGYQHPKLRAVMVSSAPEMAGAEKHTFDEKVIDITDQNMMARIYQRRITAVR